MWSRALTTSDRLRVATGGGGGAVPTCICTISVSSQSVPVSNERY